jgi:hypothetical protein
MHDTVHRSDPLCCSFLRLIDSGGVAMENIMLSVGLKRVMVERRERGQDAKSEVRGRCLLPKCWPTAVIKSDMRPPSPFNADGESVNTIACLQTIRLFHEPLPYSIICLLSIVTLLPKTVPSSCHNRSIYNV